jgi:hypothetical protein
MNAGIRKMILFSALMTVGAGAAAETSKFTGTTAASVTKSIMRLGNGGSVVRASSSGVAAISTSPPTLLEMNCEGLGLIDGNNSYSADFYCTFKANDTDSFDLKGTDTPQGGKATVIGGSGKWNGATGSGTFTRTSSTETSSATNFEISITTP